MNSRIDAWKPGPTPLYLSAGIARAVQNNALWLFNRF